MIKEDGTKTDPILASVKGPTQIELDLLESSFSTARSWEEYEMVFDLSGITPGNRVLDVGAGGSDFTAQLLGMGIDAYAVDPLYRNRSEVRRKVKEHARLMIERAGNPQARAMRIERANTSQATLDVFSESVRSNPARYLPGFASSLPFPDDFFDTVISFNCMTEYTDMDYKTFYASITEVLRVTKPGGEIQLHPFGDEVRRRTPSEEFVPVVSAATVLKGLQMRLDNQAWLMRYLDRNGISHEQLPVRSANMSFSIVKPAAEPPEPHA